MPSPQADYPEICQDYEPIRIIRRVRPETKRKLPDGSWLFNFGKNTSGRVCLKVRGANAGDRICIRMYERLDHAGDPVWGIYSDVFTMTITRQAEGGHGAEEHDVYICRGVRKSLRAALTYTGFRYACNEGYPGEPGLDEVAFMVMQLICLKQANSSLEAGNCQISVLLSCVLTRAISTAGRRLSHAGEEFLERRHSGFCANSLLVS